MTVQRKKDLKMITAAALISIACIFLFSQDAEQKLPFGNMCVAAAAIAVYAVFLWVKKESWQERRQGLLCCGMALFTVGLIRCASWFKVHSGDCGNGMLWEGTIIFGVVFLWAFLCIWLEKGFTEELVYLILFGAFLMRIFYAVMVQSHIYQNDIEFLGPKSVGHLGYVYVFYATGRLPQVNPMEYYQYYQPPLFYMVSAVFVKLFAALGYSIDEIPELLQIVSVMYGTLTLFYVNKVGIKLKVPVWSRAAVMGIAAFMPWGIIQGGALNNDGLMILLAVMALYYTLVWYENPTYRTILIMAVCIGCSMMTKLSGALAAPAMAFLMLYKAWRERKQWISYLKQFLCFGAAAFPLGLWYPLRQFVRYGMPLGYVPRIPETDGQFIGMYSKWQRFFDFENAFEWLSLRWDNTAAIDYNIPVSLVKFAAFGEGNFYYINQVLKVTGTLLFWMILIFMILTALSCLLWILIGEQKVPEKVFVMLVIAVGLYSYVKFNLAYPHVCTMHIRYIMLPVYFALLVPGALSGDMDRRFLRQRKRAGNIVRAVAAAVTGVYIVAAVTMIVELVQIIP